GGRGVPKDATQAIDQVPELLLLILFHEPRALERPQLCLDPDCLQVGEDRLGGRAGGGIAPEIAGLEAVGVTSFREELLRFRGIEGVDWWLPVEIEATGNDAAVDLR